MTSLQNKSFSPDRKPFFPPAFALKPAANVTSVTVSVAHLAIIKKIYEPTNDYRGKKADGNDAFWLRHDGICP